MIMVSFTAVFFLVAGQAWQSGETLLWYEIPGVRQHLANFAREGEYTVVVGKLLPFEPEPNFGVVLHADDLGAAWVFFVFTGVEYNLDSVG